MSATSADRLAPAVLNRLEAGRAAARVLRRTSGNVKNAVLKEIALGLKTRADEILKANTSDLATLRSDVAPAFRDRLTLTHERLAQMGESLRQVAALPDPVGEVTSERLLANGLKTKQVRSPLGVILMIFESRPNVAVESFSLAFKSGNVIHLRGGKESTASTKVLYSVITDALKTHGLPEACVWGITDPDRKLVEQLLKESRWIDVVVPRGGDSLIEFVVQNSRIPIIKNDRGMCHVYVHDDADLTMAAEIVFNAKTQRPGVCNAMETLLIHEKIASTFLPSVYAKLASKSVRWKACPRSLKILAGRDLVEPASDASFDTEYLDLILNVKVVATLEDALAHIESHGSRHSEAIITRSESVAREFQAEIDAAAVYWNASTRFTDGFELGLGGELGISTQKLHVRGPVGLRELTSVRWVMDGEGQVRA